MILKKISEWISKFNINIQIIKMKILMQYYY